MFSHLSCHFSQNPRKPLEDVDMCAVCFTRRSTLLALGAVTGMKSLSGIIQTTFDTVGTALTNATA